MSQIREIFDMVDADGNGTLSRQELVAFVAKYGGGHSKDRRKAADAIDAIFQRAGKAELSAGDLADLVDARLDPSASDTDLRRGFVAVAALVDNFPTEASQISKAELKQIGDLMGTPLNERLINEMLGGDDTCGLAKFSKLLAGRELRPQ